MQKDFKEIPNEPLFQHFLKYMIDTKQMYYTWKCFKERQGPNYIFYFHWPTDIFKEMDLNELQHSKIIIYDGDNKNYYVDPTKVNLSTTDYIKTTSFKPINFDLIQRWYELASAIYYIQSFNITQHGFQLTVNIQKYENIGQNLSHVHVTATIPSAPPFDDDYKKQPKTNEKMLSSTIKKSITEDEYDYGYEEKPAAAVQNTNNKKRKLQSMESTQSGSRLLDRIFKPSFVQSMSSSAAHNTTNIEGNDEDYNPSSSSSSSNYSSNKKNFREKNNNILRNSNFYEHNSFKTEGAYDEGKNNGHKQMERGLYQLFNKGGD